MREQSIQGIEEQLNRVGLRATRQRIAVLGTIMHATTPLSVEKMLQASSLQYDIATAYRILDALVAVGLVKKIELAQGRAFYERVGEHHHHAICTSCGTIRDIHACLPRGIDERIRVAAQFTSIEEHALDFFGTCTACAKTYG